MALNTAPIFTGFPDIQWTSTDGNGGAAGPLKTANVNLDGTGTVQTVFTADATNGGFMRSLRVKPAGANVATVLRIFINNGSASATLANNNFYAELSLPVITASATVAMPEFEFPFNFALKPGYVVNITLGTTVAGGYFANVVGGKY